MVVKKIFDVVGFGDSTLDYICFIDNIANFSQSTFISDIKVFGGGCVPTALVTLQRLGRKTAFISSLGDDVRGREIAGELIKENIDCEVVKFIKNKPSPISFIQVDKSHGNRAIAYYQGACKLREFDERAKRKAVFTKILHLDGFNPIQDLEAAKFAKYQGIKVMLDANVVSKAIEDLLPFIDYLVTSKAFLYEFTNIKNIEKALKNINGIVKTDFLVTTLGSDGSVALLNDEVFFVDSFKVKAVDTTGAGDVYHGAFLFGILNRWNIKDIMLFSSAVAAIKCTSAGRKGIPDYKSVIDFLEERKVDIERFKL
jgi:sulfofructose kinase